MTTTSRSNPWGLTAGEVRVLSAICRTGSQKAARLELGICRSTIEIHAFNSRKRMGARTPIHMVLMFDRWAREGNDQPDATVAPVEPQPQHP